MEGGALPAGAAAGGGRRLRPGAPSGAASLGSSSNSGGGGGGGLLTPKAAERALQLAAYSVHPHLQARPGVPQPLMAAALEAAGLAGGQAGGPGARAQLLPAHLQALAGGRLDTREMLAQIFRSEDLRMLSCAAAARMEALLTARGGTATAGPDADRAPGGGAAARGLPGVAAGHQPDAAAEAAGAAGSHGDGAARTGAGSSGRPAGASGGAPCLGAQADGAPWLVAALERHAHGSQSSQSDDGWDGPGPGWMGPDGRSWDHGRPARTDSKPGLRTPRAAAGARPHGQPLLLGPPTQAQAALLGPVTLAPRPPGSEGTMSSRSSPALVRATVAGGGGSGRGTAVLKCTHPRVVFVQCLLISAPLSHLSALSLGFGGLGLGLGLGFSASIWISYIHLDHTSHMVTPTSPHHTTPHTTARLVALVPSCGPVASVPVLYLRAS